MKIVMTDTAPGSVDGINTAVYESGVEYDLTVTSGSRDLAQAFVDAGLAEEVGAKAPGSATTEFEVEVPADQSAQLPELVAPEASGPAAARPGRRPKNPKRPRRRALSSSSFAATAAGWRSPHLK
jgi:hypothetical protein